MFKASYLDYINGNPATHGQRLTKGFANREEYELWIRNLEAWAWNEFCTGTGDGKIDFLAIREEGE